MNPESRQTARKHSMYPVMLRFCGGERREENCREVHVAFSSLDIRHRSMTYVMFKYFLPRIHGRR
jgi:hypothetical protein